MEGNSTVEEQPASSSTDLAMPATTGQGAASQGSHALSGREGETDGKIRITRREWDAFTRNNRDQIDAADDSQDRLIDIPIDLRNGVPNPGLLGNQQDFAMAISSQLAKRNPSFQQGDTSSYSIWAAEVMTWIREDITFDETAASAADAPKTIGELVAKKCRKPARILTLARV